MKNFQCDINIYICGFILASSGIFLLEFGWHTQNSLLTIIAKLIIVLGVVWSLSPWISQSIEEQKRSRLRKRRKFLIRSNGFQLYETIIEKFSDVIQDHNLRVIAVNKENVFMFQSSTLLVAFSIEYAWLTAEVIHKNSKTHKWHKKFLTWLIEPSERLRTEIDTKLDAFTPEFVNQGLLHEIDCFANDIRNNVNILFYNENIDVLFNDNYL